MTFFTKYVSHADIEAHQALGWTVWQSKKSCHHCAHAVIMRYVGDQEKPPEPSNEK